MPLRHVVKPGMVEHGMTEHQIRNGKTWGTISRMAKIQNTKSETVKPVTLNSEHNATNY